MEFKNLTPHDVNIELSDGSIYRIPKSDIVARLAQTDTPLCPINGVTCVTRRYLQSNLPEFKPNVLLIVSQMVAASKPLRKDLYYPGEMKRDSEGRIITGPDARCLQLCQVP